VGRVNLHVKVMRLLGRRRWDKACSEVYRHFKKHPAERLYLENYEAVYAPEDLDVNAELQKRTRYEIVGIDLPPSIAGNGEHIYVYRETNRLKRYFKLQLKFDDGGTETCHIVTAPRFELPEDDEHLTDDSYHYLDYHDTEYRTLVFISPLKVYLPHPCPNGWRSKQRYLKKGWKFTLIPFDPEESLSAKKVYMGMLNIISNHNPEYRLLYLKWAEECKELQTYYHNYYYNSNTIPDNGPSPSFLYYWDGTYTNEELERWRKLYSETHHV